MCFLYLYTMKSIEGKYILAFDTICTGWECVRDSNNQPYLYNSFEEAEADIENDEDFVVPAEDFIENRRLFFDGEKFIITGKPLSE